MGPWRRQAWTTREHNGNTSTITPSKGHHFSSFLATFLSRLLDEARLLTAYPVSSVGLVHRPPSSRRRCHPDLPVAFMICKVYPFPISSWPFSHGDGHPRIYHYIVPGPQPTKPRVLASIYDLFSLVAYANFEPRLSIDAKHQHADSN